MEEHVHSVMDRQIFNMNLSVEATSAYILVASLVSENVRPSLEIVRGRWTAEDEALDRALEELARHNVVQPRSGPEGETLYFPNPASLWR